VARLARGLVATGLEPAVDRAAARLAQLDRHELATRAAALRVASSRAFARACAARGLM